ncbi:g3914 [Coccomyxa viridis]|uniref:histone deacetylase n=1 Tax=Coccomyxa viridis TaxID=1274662 RepID=A0ABP1FNY2_9CHLO
MASEGSAQGDDGPLKHLHEDGPVRTADNTHNQSLHAEQTADKAEPDSMPSTGQAVPKEEDSVKADDQDASIQSPASTLAETLSLLSLSTPAAVEYKSSRLGQNGQQKEDDDGNHASSQTASQTRGTPDQSDAPRILVRKPAKPQEGDVSVGLVYDAIMEEHRGPPGHVERPQRTAVLVERLKETGLADRCCHVPARQATDEELQRAHTAEHVRHISGPRKDDDWLMGDNFYSELTPVAARYAAGCSVQAVQAVCRGDVDRAFAVVRPPGHHAECARAMGFCFYNNVAVAAMAARQEPGIERVLVLDWDVHHGNGIESILYDRPDIMYISLHRGNGFYPGTGEVYDAGKGPGEGFNVNIPWQRGGLSDADYIAAFDLVLEPIIGAYAPDLIIVSAGFDAVVGDPLGGMSLSPELFGHLTERMARLARGKLVLALEGGYNLRMTAECARHCMQVLLGGKPAVLDTPWKPAKDSELMLSLVAAIQAQHWPVLESISIPERFSKAWEFYLLGKQTAASLQVKSSPRTRSATKKR